MDLVTAVARALPNDDAADLVFPFGVHLCWRRKGRRITESWLSEGRLDAVLAEAVLERPSAADSVELCLPLDSWSVPTDAWHGVFADAQRGVLGMALSLGAHRKAIAPNQFIAGNRSFDRGLELTLRDWGIDSVTFRARGGALEAFTARQILLHLADPRTPKVLFRGNEIRLLPEGDAAITTMLDAAAGWLLRQLRPDGGLRYKYWPSNGRWSKADNTIRQFMATLALIDLAAFKQSARLLESATRNLEANLARFLVRDGVRAFVEFEGKAKLGAGALAALCLLRHPEEARYRQERRALERGILSLRQESGAFRTFHRPAGRNDNQNFYPGEALYYLAERLALEPNEGLRRKVLASVEHYRRFHRRDPNPAFVPWHSLALRRLQPDRALAKYLFQMNDWLAGLQQWETAPHPDMAGRFYAPDRPDFGPPHASSTGVYLEGLSAAFEVAEWLGDRPRAERYARTIWRGLRNLRQLQFLDEVDCFYVSKRERVLGGLRSEVYDNTLRIDNTQHAIAALLAVARQPALLAARPDVRELTPPPAASATGLASE